MGDAAPCLPLALRRLLPDASVLLGESLDLQPDRPDDALSVSVRCRRLPEEAHVERGALTPLLAELHALRAGVTKQLVRICFWERATGPRVSSKGARSLATALLDGDLAQQRSMNTKTNLGPIEVVAVMPVGAGVS